MSRWNIFGSRDAAAVPNEQPAAAPETPAPPRAQPVGPGVIDDTDPAQQGRVAALMALARGGRDPASDTPEILAGERSAAYQRYNGILSAYAPWLLRRVGRSSLVVEIGCGAGASTAAFAHACERIVGYDVDSLVVDQANERFRIMGVANAEARTIGLGGAPAALRQHQNVDGVIFYAVLEHMPPMERRAALVAAWEVLRPGGFLLVGESRNAAIDEPLGADSRNVGPRDFEVTFGPNYADYLVSNPDDPEIAGIFGDHSDAEQAVRARAAQAGVRLHPSMEQAHFSLLFRKPVAAAATSTHALDVPEHIAPPPAATAPLVAPAAPAPAAPPAVDLAAMKAFARDPANFDAFAEVMVEALGPQVYLAWDKDAPYKRHFKRWQKAGFTVLPNHYYSPVPDMNQLTQEQLTARYPLHGVAIDEGEHRALLKQLKAFQAETRVFRDRREPTKDGRWFGGGAFGLLDAQVAYAMVRSIKPRRIIEIGTGFSTLAMAEACERNAADGAPVEFTTIDPYPSFAVDLKPKGLTRNLTKPVEVLPMSTFEALEAGDILFIDSTHVIRPGGDVEYEYFHILPRLKPGVWIHVHDIFFPLPYPPEWARDRHIFWNEQQLLNAFLAYNHSFRTRLALSAACDWWIDAVKDAFPGTGERPGPGSFWMQRIA